LRQSRPPRARDTATACKAGRRVVAAATETGGLTELTAKLDEHYGLSNVEGVVGSLKRQLSGTVFEKEHADGLQQAGSYIDGLRAHAWHETDWPEHAWMKRLENRANVIQKEFAKVNAMKDLDSKAESAWVTAARAEAVSYGPDWRTFVLQDRELWEDTNIKLFPKTVKLIRDLDVPAVEVFFARQSPQTGIKSHTDNTNFILTSHLALDTPEGEAWIQCGNEKRYWENGKGIIMDTSYMHCTENESQDKDRFVLIIRFWHPDLDKAQRDAVRYVFDFLDHGEKVADDLLAKRRKKAAKKIPARKGGFGV